MVAAEDAGKAGIAERLGIEPGNVVAEFGWDEDVDDDVRAAVEERIGSEMLDEDTDEVLDVILMWWREDDGDLVDALMDATSPIAENVGGDIEKVLNERCVIGAFPWKIEGGEASICRIMAFFDVGSNEVRERIS